MIVVLRNILFNTIRIREFVDICIYYDILLGHLQFAPPATFCVQLLHAFRTSARLFFLCTVFGTTFQELIQNMSEGFR